MIVYIICLILGIIFSIIGTSFLILYLNLFTVGYTFSEYVNFIIRRPEVYFLIIGIILIFFAIIISGGKDYGIRL